MAAMPDSSPNIGFEATLFSASLLQMAVISWEKRVPALDILFTCVIEFTIQPFTSQCIP